MDFAAQRDPSHTAFISIAQLVPRDVRPDEIPELRAMWWRQAALGHRLPAERDVIVLNERATLLDMASELEEFA